jgi:hypothetical protein
MKTPRMRFRLAPSYTVLWLAAAVVVFVACSESPPTTTPPTCSPPCPEGQICQTGECILKPCLDGQTRCGDQCVNAQEDAQHCGRCETACAQGVECVGGVCQGGEGGGGCAGGGNLTNCGGTCVDTLTDGQHCGDCDHACAAGQSCAAGECSCGNGLRDCGGTCVDTATDPSHCGNCDTACTDQHLCVSGTCDCMGGLTDCGGTCTDTQVNAQHCGRCDVTCNSRQACRTGVCTCTVVAAQNLGSTVPQTVTGTTIGAPSSYAPGCGPSSSREQIFSFTAPTAGLYAFNTTGSSFNTVIAVVDSAGCTELRCNADPGGVAQTSADLAAGQTVYVVVDGANGAAGSFTLRVTRVSVSGCPAGNLGSTVPQTVTGSTSGRPNSVTPSCNATGSSPDAGYTFTAPAAGSYTFDTFGSGFDTVIHVHNASCTGAELGCNDDGASEQSEVTLTLAAGQTVVVVVDGFNGTSGLFTLHIYPTPPPPTCDGSDVCGDSTSGCIECALESTCGDERLACTDTLRCREYVSCILTCSTPGCTSGCAATYPDGAMLYDAILACLYCDVCPTDCASVDYVCP